MPRSYRVSSILRGGTASIAWGRLEPIGFVPVYISYRVTGFKYPWYPATHEHPAEGGECEIRSIARQDPFSREFSDVPEKNWDFTPEELSDMEETLEHAPLDLEEDFFED